MTIQAQDPRINYTADGIQDTFAYDFIVLDETDLEVYEDGVLTILDYSVTGIGTPSGGTVVYTSTVPADGVGITILRNVPLTQEVDYQPYDPFPADTHEGALDKLTQISQQQQDEIDRSLKSGIDTPPGITYTLPFAEQNKGLYWEDDPNPTAIVNGPTIAEIEADKDAAAASAAASAASAAASASSASASATSETNAATSETNAAASEVTSESWSDKAQEWAENDYDDPVEPGQYSAKHWATFAQIASGLPTGMIVPSPLDIVPVGWLLCNGQAVSRASYSALFAAYGVKYGNGDGSTTFNLPDYRGLFLRGTDHGAGIDPDAASRTDRGDGTTGDNVGTQQAEDVGPHNHRVNMYSHNAASCTGVLAAGNPGTSSCSGPMSQNNTGVETRPINISVDFICFTGVVA